MYADSLTLITKNALNQLKRMEESIPKYLVSSGLAGAYIGLAVVLVMIIGGQLSQASSPYTSLFMGAAFGLALTLVIFAGADLFTGNNMFFTVSTLAGATSIKDTIKNWFWCYTGNFLGAFLFCLIIFGSGIFATITPDHILMTIASTKMNLSYSEAFFRGILCNWIVCLAIWMGLRTKSEPVKLIIIYACLFAFFVSGFEHSIANMSVLTLSLLLPHPETITVAGFAQNLVPVTLGNIVGGAVFVGMIYTLLSNNNKQHSKEVRTIKAS
ncbi:formate/nitrite transporter family protein [Halalkalibacter nanhaiisediminis]|uniref:Nitrite transporter NirC n=1 Tax=Halalkalibacter nanhaiisediminis TaxID=688079 RepID=A0A562QQQ1_9BACI|nr:formate/nitrite transporter family protein [Halalkalibacter nanhaiisediminis]TWI59082.1 nitrite transporter NirC [Halalkalibacter nanhaiisediminis]